MSTPERFHALMRQVTGLMAGQALDAALQQRLNQEAGPDSALYADIFATCRPVSYTHLDVYKRQNPHRSPA